MSASKDSTASSSKATSGRTNGDDLRRAVDWVLKDGILNDVRLHGNVSWTPMALVRLAVDWVWNAESSLVAAKHRAGWALPPLPGLDESLSFDPGYSSPVAEVVRLRSRSVNPPAPKLSRTHTKHSVNSLRRQLAAGSHWPGNAPYSRMTSVRIRKGSAN